jgi:hypothetical protein
MAHMKIDKGTGRVAAAALIMGRRNGIALKILRVKSQAVESKNLS